MAKRLQYGWFVNYMPTAWKTPWAPTSPEDWTDGKFYVRMGQMLESAGVDFIMLEDSVTVPDTFGGSMELEMKYTTRSPKGDPLPLAAAIGAATKNLGLVVTMSTTLYPPWMLARTLSTLDHLTRGRVGWNIVTSTEDRAVQNFGMDTIFEHDHRYERAHEFVDLVKQLWDSWEPDALVMDKETGTYVDHTKVHPIDFEGEYFRSRGPLNTLRMPQGRPVIAQAGMSNAGRDLAAAHADVIVSAPKGKESMKEYRDDIRARMEKLGRDPDSCKILYMVTPVVGETVEEAREKHRRMYELDPDAIMRKLALMSSGGNTDWAQFDLDAPIPDDLPDSSMLAEYRRVGAGRTLRQIISGSSQSESLTLVGTPETIVDEIEEVMDYVGGDGFLWFAGGGGLITRHYLSDVLDGLMPELKRRGLARDKYEHQMLKDNLALT
ncbi:NtaA/DmoA family FMN-dependent monooxygenase [Nocardioides bruguierae]|uniref:NtaA/DmoA family FMN-dependent monooxygenase n=1 Tax=Nocardioides bruguierae TaxID=2945102 RepID=UPI002020DF14|nr:NtaA/DmoA family FMN-dependent monooxygenase [Nocardioides bruguierae]MCL8025753.1 NtaA/DmoA family FMN-dependent monooxygenase [Nocardioides bruguierae]